MGGLFSGGNNQAPERLSQTRINQSVYGLPYPVVVGTAQVQQNILWIDGFVATKQSSGGKGGGGKGGGGKSGTGFYTYTADVVAALCNGPITAIGDVWSGQSWLGNPTASESYTISGSGVYTPANASSLNNDLGVSVQNTYSGTYNDYGAPWVNNLSSSDYAAMMNSPYGSYLASGQYSINPANGDYYFSAADLGKTVNLSYSYTLTNINQQENDVIPAGKTISITVTSTQTFGSDFGVRYAAGANEGVALTKVSGTPSVTGTYQVTGSKPTVYHFATGDVAAEVTITYSISDPTAVGQGQSTQLNFTLNKGTAGQSPFAFLTASYPSAAFGYTSLATILYQPMGLGAAAELQQNKFEVITPDIYGGGILDCNPITCITKVFTNAQWGLGVGPIPFPTSILDNGATGTWGGPPTTSGTRLADSTAWSWFSANNFFISPVIDSQDTAASVMSKWLEAGMCAAFISEGLLKLVPYGDTSTALNGCTWIAPQTFVVALDDTCFVGKEGEDPVKITRAAAHDVWNCVQVQWDNRFNQYSPEITQESDQSLINRWGERREDAQDWSFIHTLPAAIFAANMRLKHDTYVRNTYEFTLPYTYSYLEPMDICTISTTSIWAAGLNNANLGIVNLPIRILKIVDDPAKGLSITAEDYPFGAHQPAIYNKQISNGDVAANAFVDPGSAEVVMFEATSRMTGYSGDEIWIGANGTSKNYGFTNIWVSSDGGSTYKQIGTIKAPARMGVLDSTFASGSDPDTTNSLVVDLVENCAAWEAGSSGDADYGNTQTFVDGEIISYSALTATGQDQITMDTYIRRGQMDTTISSHSAGGLVLRLDDAIFKYQYDPIWRGVTLKFKFQAVNCFGNNAQALSSLTPVSYIVPGLNPGTVDAFSGLIVASDVAYSGGATVQSLKPAQAGADVTSSHTSADTSAVNSIPAANISASLTVAAWAGSTAYTVGMNVTYSGNTYKCKTANSDASWTIAHWTLVGPSSLDAVSDGSTYAKPLATALTSGQVDLGQAGVIGKTASNIKYGSTVTVESLMPAEAGAEVTTGKSVDVLVDGATYARTSASILTSGSIKPAHISDQAVGYISTATMASGSAGLNHVFSGWYKVASGVLNIPAGTASITLHANLATQVSGSGSGLTGIGFAIYSGADPGSPQVYHTGVTAGAGWNGDLTLNSPATGAGLVLALYVYGDGNNNKVTATPANTLTQEVTSLFNTGVLT